MNIGSDGVPSRLGWMKPISQLSLLLIINLGENMAIFVKEARRPGAGMILSPTSKLPLVRVRVGVGVGMEIDDK